jgi:hemerythrin
MNYEWTPSLAVGHSTIDTQHQEWFRRANALVVAMKEGKGRDEIEKTLTFLSDYVVTHFRDEEALMQKNNYPGYPDQKKQHDQYVKVVQDAQKDFREKGANSLLVIKLMENSFSWLTNHITKLDKNLGEYLKTKA